MKSDFGKTAAETACKQEKIHLHACGIYRSCRRVR